MCGRCQSSPSSRRAWIEILIAVPSTFAILVALLTEGVDRNKMLQDRHVMEHVALLTEGVDRNSSMPL